MKTEAQKPTQPEPKNKKVKEPWDKGKLMGQKPPLKLRKSGKFGLGCNLVSVYENLLCSI